MANTKPIKERRISLNLSLRTVSLRTNLPIKVIARYENNFEFPSIEAIMAIHNVLGLPLNVIIPPTLPGRIRYMRLKQGLTIDELADLIQKDRVIVYRYEKDVRIKLSHKLLHMLAKALNTSPTFLVGKDSDLVI